MLNLKKTAIAVLTLSSSAVFAGTMGSFCTPLSVSVPCKKNTWDFSAYTLYLSSETNENNHDNEQSNISDSYITWPYLINLEHNLGFKLISSYYLNSGNDITFNWNHWQGNEENNIHQGDLIELIPNKTSMITDISGENIKPKWNSMNLEFGQTINLNNLTNIRIHTGIQYSNIERDQKLTLSSQDFANNNLLYKESTQYTGMGPNIGTDITYNFGNGFSIYGKGSTAILSGDHKSISTHFNEKGEATYDTKSKTSIIPGIETQLGAKYTYMTNKGDITLNTGWTWISYSNVIDTINRNSLSRNSNFSIYGPFFGIKWTSNM
ncbi:hypothetical protein CCU22_01885 [Candidatus Legionella polyplacis]|uniref:Lpg1974 family pore-forming outer membrane protein n=1 Tax=Candidatus Legionella polyplacis TaxID=2005262 RepID=A0ABZ2GXD4_9GAMM|nr:Lpg1974 family pore-forming outer membrane protein [Candidatus Legionella polyplacis]ATW01943.1 hypothetical protein CCU22_01885 [Candidatus Legionella polyplacis]